LVACDMIGMGGSEKLSPSGPDSYHYAQHREYLHALWDDLDLGDNVVLVLHDWGSALGFDWANNHRDRIQGIAYMEALVAPITWSDFPEAGRAAFQALRSEAGDQMVLADNAFVEAILPGGVLRGLTDEEMSHYRSPYLNSGEDRRPTLSWPRNLPIGGQPADVVAVVEEYSGWLATSAVPKLFINSEPGNIPGVLREFARTWPNQREITVPGLHFVQEDSPDEIGTAVADFVRRLRSIPE
jgi:haloalkane dehalogenase